jgi:hypothetical protein
MEVFKFRPVLVLGPHPFVSRAAPVLSNVSGSGISASCEAIRCTRRATVFLVSSIRDESSFANSASCFMTAARTLAATSAARPGQSRFANTFS